MCACVAVSGGKGMDAGKNIPNSWKNICIDSLAGGSEAGHRTERKLACVKHR